MSVRLPRNVARWMTTPLTGLVVLGSNGEAPQLEDDEADRVVEIARAGVPRIRPLIAGTGRESTRATIAATRRRGAPPGVDAVLVRTPSFFKAQMTADVFVRHYTRGGRRLAGAGAALQRHACTPASSCLPDAVERLAEHPNIVGMKESGSDIGQIAEYVARTPDDFTVLAGSATTLLPRAVRRVRRRRCWRWRRSVPDDVRAACDAGAGGQRSTRRARCSAG